LEADPYLLQIASFLNVKFYSINISSAIGLFSSVLLLAVSALISASEVACFSLTPTNRLTLQRKKERKYLYLNSIISKPERLLATILITNNFVNILIVILSTLFFVYDSNVETTQMALIDFSESPTFGFIFQVFVVTFMILLFGEIMPKVYATYLGIRFAFFMTYPLYFLEKVLSPLSSILIYSTSIVNRRVHKKQNISMSDLSNALHLTENSIKEDKEILKGIVKFGNTEVKEIMRPRIDVEALNLSEQIELTALIKMIAEIGYSRLPVYKDSFDDIKGILVVKDLLPYIDKPEGFDLERVLRNAYFVPESKRISDLLEEFQIKKIHIAIVIDEYGGTSGIVTLEDILEEIVGDISDEYDYEELNYTKIDDKTYSFEGKFMLNDFHKVIDSEPDMFDSVRGDADTLAGLILELKGEFPVKDEIFNYNNFEFKVEAVDKRRIKKIRVRIK